MILPQFGARVTRSGGALTVDGGAGIRGGATIPGLDLDLSTGGELAPAIVALLAFADGPSRITGIGHLRGHETDRLAALSTELNRLGGAVTELEDGLAIEPRPLHGGIWRSYEDHRMATAGALVGLAVEGVDIDDIGTTAKTLPQFPELWRSLLGLERRRPRAGSRCCRELAAAGFDDDDGDFAGWDESDAKVRPNPKGNRPRTKIRPEHGDAVEAGCSRSTAAGTRCSSTTAGRTSTCCSASAPASCATRRSSPATSSTSSATPRATRAPSAASSASVPARRVLRRSADDTDTVERVIVANADQLLIVVATANPEPRPAAGRPLPGGGLRRRHHTRSWS